MLLLLSWKLYRAGVLEKPSFLLTLGEQLAIQDRLAL